LSSIHDGHRRRMKERFLNNGIDNFAPHEVLEILLGFGKPQGNLNPTAHELINHFGSLSAVFDAPYHELLKVNNVGPHTACLIKLVLEVNKRYLLDKQLPEKCISSHEQAGKLFSDYCHGKTNEIVMGLYLDNTGRVKGLSTISEGVTNVAAINTRRLYEEILKYNPTKMMVAHNHPHGFALPSPDDVSTTLQIAKFLKPIGVELMDHILVSADDFVSLASSKEYAYLFDL